MAQVVAVTNAEAAKAKKAGRAGSREGDGGGRTCKEKGAGVVRSRSGDMFITHT